MKNHFPLSVLLTAAILLWACESQAQSGWTWQNPLPQGNLLNDVEFTDKDTGIAVGDFGTILRTMDGGVNWITVPSRTTDDLYDISFIDQFYGNIVGDHTILQTTDGGQTWTMQHHPGWGHLRGISFPSINTGIVVGYYDAGWEYPPGSVIVRTTDGGRNWTFQRRYPQGGLHGIFL